jgi:MFS family permease
VFLVAVIEEFRWSRGLASGALMLGSVLWTLSAPVIGVALDRFGPRLVLATGALLMASGFIVSGLASSIVEFYLGMGVLMGIGFAALPMTAQATFLSNWFIRKRGMAIGTAASGIGIGILLVVPWTQWLISSYGWRAAYFVIAALLMFGVAPLNYFFQRQRPEEMNLKPDFGQTEAGPRPGRVHGSAAGGPSLRDALRSWRFWSFAAGVLAGAIPQAALGLGLIGLFTAPAMIGMGLLADRIGRQTSYAIGSASLMVGIFLLTMIEYPARQWLFYVLPPFIAFGFSSRQSLYPTMAADLFHGGSFGAIIGAISLFIGVGAGIGPWLGGLLHDQTGSYHAALWLAQATAFASVLFISLAGARGRG